MKKVLIFGLLLVALAIAGGRAKAVDLLDYEVAFFNNGTCTGDDFIKVGKGDFPDFRSLQNAWKDGAPKENWNDKVSCIQLGSNGRVTLYEHINFKGASKSLYYTEKNGGKISFAGTNWNDRTSSAKVPIN